MSKDKSGEAKLICNFLDEVNKYLGEVKYTENIDENIKLLKTTTNEYARVFTRKDNTGKLGDEEVTADKLNTLEKQLGHGLLRGYTKYNQIDKKKLEKQELYKDIKDAIKKVDVSLNETSSLYDLTSAGKLIDREVTQRADNAAEYLATILTVLDGETKTPEAKLLGFVDMIDELTKEKPKMFKKGAKGHQTVLLDTNVKSKAKTVMETWQEVIEELEGRNKRKTESIRERIAKTREEREKAQTIATNISKANEIVHGEDEQPTIPKHQQNNVDSNKLNMVNETENQTESLKKDVKEIVQNGGKKNKVTSTIQESGMPEDKKEEKNEEQTGTEQETEKINAKIAELEKIPQRSKKGKAIKTEKLIEIIKNNTQTVKEQIAKLNTLYVQWQNDQKNEKINTELEKARKHEIQEEDVIDIVSSYHDAIANRKDKVKLLSAAQGVIDVKFIEEIMNIEKIRNEKKENKLKEQYDKYRIPFLNTLIYVNYLNKLREKDIQITFDKYKDMKTSMQEAMNHQEKIFYVQTINEEKVTKSEGEIIKFAEENKNVIPVAFCIKLLEYQEASHDLAIMKKNGIDLDEAVKLVSEGFGEESELDWILAKGKVKSNNVVVTTQGWVQSMTAERLKELPNVNDDWKSHIDMKGVEEICNKMHSEIAENGARLPAEQIKQLEKEINETVKADTYLGSNKAIKDVLAGKTIPQDREYALELIKKGNLNLNGLDYKALVTINDNYLEENKEQVEIPVLPDRQDGFDMTYDDATNVLASVEELKTLIAELKISLPALENLTKISSAKGGKSLKIKGKINADAE